MHVYLIGYRGSGKSSAAIRLGELSGLPCHSSDARVAAGTGKTIRAIFAEDGEAAFRQLEHEAILQLSQSAPSIIDLGGGAVLREDNRRLLKRTGSVVWLRAAAECLRQRIQSDPKSAEQRPSLLPGSSGSRDSLVADPSADPLLSEIQQVLASRYPIYNECADCVVDTDALSPLEVAERIMQELPCFR